MKEENKMFVKVALKQSAQVLTGTPEEIVEFVVLNDFGLSQEELNGIRAGETEVLIYADGSFELFPTTEFWGIFTVVWDA